MATIDRPLLSTDLDGIFRPSSVAIYGISDRTSVRIAENMTVAGVPFYGINPTREEACGIRCYPSIGDCPAVPEMVVMGVGHGRIEDAIGDVLSIGGRVGAIRDGHWQTRQMPTATQRRDLTIATAGLDALERDLKARSTGAAVMVYACGPEPMLAAVAKIAAAYGWPSQVSVERVMGCGLGGCYSCVVPMKSDTGGFHHERSCISGPVLAADQIVWD